MASAELEIPAGVGAGSVRGAESGHTTRRPGRGSRPPGPGESLSARETEPIAGPAGEMIGPTSTGVLRANVQKGVHGQRHLSQAPSEPFFARAWTGRRPLSRPTATVAAAPRNSDSGGLLRRRLLLELRGVSLPNNVLLLRRSILLELRVRRGVPQVPGRVTLCGSARQLVSRPAAPRRRRPRREAAGGENCRDSLQRMLRRIRFELL